MSVPTASKTVNGREDVAPETRRKGTEALDRLHYVRRPRFEVLVRPYSYVAALEPGRTSRTAFPDMGPALAVRRRDRCHRHSGPGGDQEIV